MSPATRSPRDFATQLEEWSALLEGLDWSAAICDADWSLRWVSTSLQTFVHLYTPEELGYGLHLAEAWTKMDGWRETATPDTQVSMFLETAPLFVRAMIERGQKPEDVIGEPWIQLLEQVEPVHESPLMWAGGFDYLDPRDPELPPYRVNFCTFRLFDETGTLVGNVLVFFLGMNPNLMSLLVRGDASMYRRMARLVDPQPQQGAVLFCDVNESGRLSRELSSAAYFRLIRRLWRGVDEVIAQECGIVGKHAGDGASAFFLSEDLDSAGGAAAAAIRAARRIHDVARDVAADVTDGSELLKVGLHWGGSLYMGQLVPGGRLDITALGDEVNEAARVQECAGAGTTLATKQLLERLGRDLALELGLDLDALRFTPLRDHPTASEKARRDAGGVAVMQLP